MDLRKFLGQLQDSHELRVVENADRDLEIGVITELCNERNGPALLFDHITGYPAGYRVVSNLTATLKRQAMAFGLPVDLPNVELVRRIKDRLVGLKPIVPVPATAAPVLDNVQEGEDVDLLKFPSPRWHEHDGGRYIGTADLVITRDPVEGWVNAGTYRIQVHDSRTLGLYIVPGHHARYMRESYWAQGKACPVAAVFGAHPLVWMPAYLQFPWGSEEFAMAGGLLGQPLEVIKGEHTGLPIPAYSEVAIEGECPPPEVESRQEGPFGEWPGYYTTGARQEAVIRVKRVMYRRDPIIVGAPPLKPPGSAHGHYIVHAAYMWHELEKLGIPGVKGLWCNRSGSNRYIIVVSVQQKYAGHARQAAMAAMSGPEGAFHGRFVIVVDEDIDPSNQDDVLWALATRCDPATAIEVVTGCWSTPLDPIMPPEKRKAGDLTNSRAMLLACRPYHWMKDFPKVNRASDELRAKTLAKWKAILP
ncbi:MAG: UbiD family decarboxylase [Chloroflexi bacterium]|nr:UbiD family decarboxylase [Chloroflexota bacterium]